MSTSKSQVGLRSKWVVCIGGLGLAILCGSSDATGAKPPTTRPTAPRALIAPRAKPAPKPTIKRALTTAQAERFASLSLHCAAKEFPYKLGQVLRSKANLKSPKELHPAFYGCFDWHSAVHGHWSMVRLLKRHPKMKSAGKIKALLSKHLTLANIKKEAAFFRTKHHKTFERPYGWGWFLRLAAELHTWDAPFAKPWRASLKPLETLLVQRVPSYLKRLTVPVRAGTHASTAFALVHIYDYAETTEDRALIQAIVGASKRFYGRDRSCPTAYEPSGEDFISPCLAEADLMRRVLKPKSFQRWLGWFLPPLMSKMFKPVREPPLIKDRKDYKIGHLVGLLLHRSWSLRGIASQLKPKDRRRQLLLSSANKHRASARKQLFDSGYGGRHWLASFAIYDLTGVGIQPTR